MRKEEADRKIIIETKNKEQDEKIRLGKMQKELKNAIMRFGYNCKEVDACMDIQGPEECELVIAYRHGYEKGFEYGQREAILEKYTPNQIRGILGLDFIKEDFYK